MNKNRLQDIKIAPDERKRRSGPFLWIVLALLVPSIAALVMAAQRNEDQRTIGDAEMPSAPIQTTPETDTTKTSDNGDPNVDLTVSGYIVNRQRIELSPRRLGVVTWLGVKKGDTVKAGDKLVLLDDSEERAQLAEAQGRLAIAEAAVNQVQTKLDRARVLLGKRVGSEQDVDNLEGELDVEKARVEAAKGALQVAQTYLSWTVIRSPIDGVVLEKLVDENELVTPQSFGGDRGPSTALVALADPGDLQVEIDLNERDLAKVHLGQRCKVSPEAYPDLTYDGSVVECAPEASRQKGTLEVKVQIENPDQYLIPNLTARVDFLTPDSNDAAGK